MADSAVAPTGVEDSITVRPEPAGAHQVRRFVRTLLSRASLDGDTVDTAMLLASELTTNGILHARSDIEVTVKVSSGSVRVEVADENPRLPTPAIIPPDALSGRGLQVVQAAAHSWGIESDDLGKVIWFELHGIGRQ